MSTPGCAWFRCDTRKAGKTQSRSQGVCHANLGAHTTAAVTPAAAAQPGTLLTAAPCWLPACCATQANALQPVRTCYVHISAVLQRQWCCCLRISCPPPPLLSPWSQGAWRTRPCHCATPHSLQQHVACGVWCGVWCCGGGGQKGKGRDKTTSRTQGFQEVRVLWQLRGCHYLVVG